MIVALVLVAYSNTWDVPLLLDDHFALTENPSISERTTWRGLFSPPASSPTAGRPVLNLSFALDRATGGLGLARLHGTNLAIHVAAALVLFGVVRRTLCLPGMAPRLMHASLPAATFAAAWWAVHPLLTSAVTYISQRAESLMGLCYLLTLYAFIRSTRASTPGGWLMASAAACFLGMATKEVMVTAPVLVLAYDRVFVSGSFRAAWNVRRGYYLSLAVSWVLLAWLMGSARLGARNVGFDQGVTPWAYALTESKVIAQYLKLALWPHPLVFDYGTEILNEPGRAWPFAFAVGLVGWGAWKLWRTHAGAGFLLVVVFLLLAPTSSLIPIALQPMAESRMYLPLAALTTLLAVSLAAWVGRPVLSVAALAVLGCAVASRARNEDYRTVVGLWADTVARNPHSARAHHSLANELARDPLTFGGARAHYEAALRIQPGDAEVHSNFGVLLSKRPGGSRAAIEHYERAIRLDPAYVQAHLHLAGLLARERGGAAAARSHYEAALRLNPGHAEAHYNLGRLLAADPQRASEAIRHYEAALRSRPAYAEAHNNLANEIAKLPGRSADALAHYEQAVRLKPDFAEAQNNLAAMLARRPGGRHEAIAHYREAIRVRPDFAEAHYNLANELAQIEGGAREAIEHYKAALAARPDLAVAHNNLAQLHFKTGALDDAIRELEAALRVDPNYEDARRNLESLQQLKTKSAR